MSRLRNITVLWLALLALLSPTATTAFSAVVLEGATIVRADDGTLHTEVARPCKAQGGKRVLPCTPDTGVLVRTPEPAGLVALMRARPEDDPLLSGVLPEAVGPPPRAA